MAMNLANNRNHGAHLTLAHVGRISRQLLNQIRDLVRDYIPELVGTLLSATGLAILLPSLAVVVVNALGFTSVGVLAGSIAALIQSHFYGALTGGLFAFLQSLGATAVVAAPGVLIVGGICVVAGARILRRYL